MTLRDLVWRLSGLAFVAAAGGISLMHKHFLADQAAGSSSGVETCLALASFLLAMAGVLLIINGARLRDRWHEAVEQAKTERDSAKRNNNPLNVEAPPVAIDPDAFGSGRTAMAAHLILRARTAATPTRGSARRLSVDRSSQ